MYNFLKRCNLINKLNLFKIMIKNWALLLKISIIIPSFLITVHISSAEVFYVDDDAAGGDGSSWSSAYRHLQDAIAVAQSGDEIWLAEGTYMPDDGAGLNKADRTAFFELNGVSLYGGFVGTELTRDPLGEAEKTILSGEIAADPDLWSLHVVIVTGESVFMDRITVTKGNANGEGLAGYGGGGIGLNSNITNCIFSNNSATNGGAVYGTGTFTNCTFSNNSATNGGAAYGISTFTDCTFSDNSATNGGAIYGTGTVLNSLFKENIAVEKGGAVFGDGSFTNSTFDNNNAQLGGAAYGNGSAENLTFISPSDDAVLDYYVLSEIPEMSDFSEQLSVALEAISTSSQSYAPESLDGLSVKIHDLETSPGSGDYGEDTKYFTAQKVYSWEENQFENTTFSYVKNSANSATLTIHHDDRATNTIYYLMFSSENSATGTWSEVEDTVTYSGTTTFTIIDEEYVPDYLNGWKLDAGESTYKFTGDSTGVFYHVDEGNYSNSELSNITYTWEKAGPGVAKLYTSLDEITWLFFEDNTTGRYHWQGQEQENESSGDFSLNYYPDGHARESLVGSSLKLGDTYYVFTSDTSVTVSEGNSSSIMEYAYLKNGSNNGILSIDPENRFVILDLDFSSSEYGTVVRGGNGVFRVLQNWETKGWVWYGHYPWAYSHNMQDWYYQVLFTNAENESDMAHYQIWDKQWKIPGELNYLGESNFSTDDAYSWEEYDDFSGSDLNTTRWDVGYWGGGQPVTISNGQAELSGVAFSSSSAVEMPSDLVAAAQGSTEGNTFLFFTDDDIYGIQADIFLPAQGNASEAGIYLASLDVSPLGSLGAELRYETGAAFFLFDYFDSGTELEHSETGSLDTFYQLQITKIGGKTSYYLDNILIKQFDSSSHDEDYWAIGAFNDDGLPYLTYADNIRVLRKKSYPQGWMWMDYFPWVYCQDLQCWMYFSLVKDSNGNPSLMFWDDANENWDLYYPALSNAQAEEKEKADQLLNDN